MPIDIIEMFWVCAACKHKNLGRNNSCQNCGKEKDDKDEELIPDDVSHEAAVTDQKLLETFKAGADNICRYCNSHQRKKTNTCEKCGADLSEGRSREDTRKVNPITNKVIKESDTTKQKPEEESYEYEYLSPKPINSNAIFIAVALFFVGFAWYFLSPTYVTASLSKAYWKHTVIVERKQIVAHEGFDDDMPFNAFDVVHFGQRFHHSERVVDHYDSVRKIRQVSCGQTCVNVPRICTSVPQTCYTTPRNCRSNKNGSATCSGGDKVCSGGGQSCSGGGQSCKTKYCDQEYTDNVPIYVDRPVMKNYSSWKSWDWLFNRNVVAEGVDMYPGWPSDKELMPKEKLNEGEEERTNKESYYSITFFDGKKQYTKSLKSEDEYRRYELGKNYKLKVNAIFVEVIGRVN